MTNTFLDHHHVWLSHI